MPHGGTVHVHVHNGVFFGFGDGGFDSPYAFARGIVQLALHQFVGHEAVVDAVHIHIEAEGEEVVVVDADRIVSDEVAKFIGSASHRVGAVAAGSIFRLHRFRLDDASGADSDAQVAVAFEAPVNHVVVVSNHGCRAQDEHARRAPRNFMFFVMTPRWITAVAFEETRRARMDFRHAVFIGHQAIHINCI